MKFSKYTMVHFSYEGKTRAKEKKKGAMEKVQKVKNNL